MWNGIYDWYDFAPETINKLRIPPAVHGYLLIVLLMPLVPQRFVRPVVLYTGLAFLWLFMGLPFALGVVSASVLVYAMTPALVRWSRRSGRPAPATALGWTVIHLLYLPFFFVKLPHIAGMEFGELTQFCGVGFMVLKASQYVWDSCRGRIVSVRWDRFLLFMTFLPTFRLGPVDRYQHFDEEIDTCKSRIAPRGVAFGFWRVAVGTAKMLVVGLVIEEAFFPDPRNIPFGQEFFDNAPNLSVGRTWVSAYMLTLRLYLIFSGYSDGAIGMSYIMGVRTPENFRWPLLVTNVRDFWRRWHISMSTWLRDYVYIPLGGNRRRTSLAVFVVFLYCGLWHYPVSAGPLFFALLHTVSLTLSRKWRTYAARTGDEPTPLGSTLRRLGLIDALPARLIGWFVTWHVLVFSVLFLMDHKHSGLRAVGRMFGLITGPGN